MRIGGYLVDGTKPKTSPFFGSDPPGQLQAMDERRRPVWIQGLSLRTRPFGVALPEVRASSTRFPVGL